MFRPLLCVMCHLSYQCWSLSWLYHEFSELHSLLLMLFFALTQSVLSKYIVHDVLERIWDDLDDEEDIYGFENDEGEDDCVSDNKYSYGDEKDSLEGETGCKDLIKPRQIMLEMVFI